MLTQIRRGRAITAVLCAWATMLLALSPAPASAQPSSVVSYLAQELGTDAQRLLAVLEQPSAWTVPAADTAIDHLLVSPFAHSIVAEVSELPTPPDVQDFVSRLGGTIPISGSREFDLHRSEAAAAARVYGGAVLLVEFKAEIERLLLRAAAAKHTLPLMERWGEAATLAASLLEQQSETGAASRAQLSEGQIFAAQAMIAVTRAKLHAEETRSSLARKLDVEVSDLRIPAILPDIPNSLPLAERQESATRADALAAQWRRILSAFDRKQDARDLPTIQGVVPDGLIATEIEIARSKAEGAHRLASIMRDEVLPLSRTLFEERVLQYNGMLIDVLDLLAATRSDTENEIEAVAATLEYFLAKVDLDLAQHVISLGTSIADATEAPLYLPEKSKNRH